MDDCLVQPQEEFDRDGKGLCGALDMLVKACSVPLARDTRKARRGELDGAYLCLPQEEQEGFRCGVFQQCVCQSGSSDEMKSQAALRD